MIINFPSSFPGTMPRKNNKKKAKKAKKAKTLIMVNIQEDKSSESGISVTIQESNPIVAYSPSDELGRYVVAAKATDGLKTVTSSGLLKDMSKNDFKSWFKRCEGVHLNRAAYNTCDVCPAPSTKKCSGCRAARYCSHQCHKSNWSIHKKLCSSFSDRRRVLKDAELQHSRVGGIKLRRQCLRECICIACGLKAVPRTTTPEGASEFLITQVCEQCFDQLK